MARKKQPKPHPNPAFDKAKMPSRHTTVGPERAPHRSYLYAMGLNEKQIGQPIVRAELVGPAVDGAVTHPGAKKESHIFAGI